MTTYIAEIAGKDSIAAVHKIMREQPVDVIIPTIVYTSTEYGDLSAYTKSIKYLAKCGKQYGVTVADTLTLHDETLWNYICIRYQNQAFAHYGFFTPCIMCHFFAHLLRVPVYLEKAGSGIITGERYSHKGKVKANQQYDTIECFRTLFNRHGIPLIQPLIQIEDTAVVENEISDYSNISSINDVKCILSGNMTGFSISDSEYLSKQKRYLNKFVEPVGEYLLNCYMKHEQIRYKELDEIIGGCFYE